MLHKPDTVVVLSWHPQSGSATAGGFRRAVEIVDRWPALADVVTVDASPTMFAGPGLHVVTYPVPALAALDSRSRELARAIQWPLAAAMLTALGLWHGRRKHARVVYTPTSELFPCIVSAFIVSRLLGVPLVVSNTNTRGIFARRLVLWLHRRADAVVTISNALATELRAAGVNGAVHVNECGDPTPAWVDSVSEPEQRRGALFIGRHTKEKGILALLDIWEAVLRHRPDDHLTTIGSCGVEMRRLIDERVAGTALEGSVSIRGEVSDEEKYRLLRGAQVLTAASFVEGWGFTPLEALAAGTPTVCWALPAYTESLPAGPAIARVDIGDIEAFAAATIDTLSETSSERRARIDATRATTVRTWAESASAEFEIVEQAAMGAKNGSDRV
jgi:glycosyltransferase involved in cell wall biosynthesis